VIGALVHAQCCPEGCLVTFQTSTQLRDRGLVENVDSDNQYAVADDKSCAAIVAWTVLSTGYTCVHVVDFEEASTKAARSGRLVGDHGIGHHLLHTRC
jgi:hypothetical protein